MTYKSFELMSRMKRQWEGLLVLYVPPDRQASDVVNEAIRDGRLPEKTRIGRQVRDPHGLFDHEKHANAVGMISLGPAMTCWLVVQTDDEA